MVASAPREDRYRLARWAAVCRLVEHAPPDWQAWARRELTACPVGEALAARLGWAPPQVPGSDRGFDEIRDAADREALGQFFTPAPLADLLAEVAGIGGDDDRPDAVALDPACGAGSLLRAVLDARSTAGWGTSAALDAVEGWDRDPDAVFLCRATLVAWALARPDGPLPGLLRVWCVDALADDGRPGDLLARRGPFRRGVGAVVSNPPYLEAKRMSRVAPELRARLRERFPQLTGAFDLYLAFCWRALEQLGEGGRAALLLPNKVLQGRYATPLRAHLAEAGALSHVVDLSRMHPRPFPGTGVYPVVLGLSRRPRPLRVRRILRPSDLSDAPYDRIDPGDLARVGGEHPLFVPFETWPDLAPLFALPRLGSVATLASTCSFHARGLRERFVTPTRPDAHAHPYLGGPSRARRTEVAPFRVAWSGWWIRMDQDALRREHRNPLPDLHRTFLRPKAVWCQHGVRMRVVADFEGRWVTKDVYPVAWPTAPGWTLERLVGVLSSTVFTALYNTVYQGIVCGGATYHYLPAFLRHVPVPATPPDVDALVRRLHEGDGPVDAQGWEELDRRIAEAYGVDEAARQRMIDVHLRPVGAEVPGA